MLTRVELIAEQTATGSNSKARDLAGEPKMKTGKMLVYATVICGLLSVSPPGQAHTKGWLVPAWTNRNQVKIRKHNKTTTKNYQ